MKHQQNMGPKSGVPSPATPKKSKKSPKFIKKKRAKIEKNVIQDIVNFQFFQNGHFWTPLKMSFFGPLFWRFCEKLFLRILEFSGGQKKVFQKVVPRGPNARPPTHAKVSQNVQNNHFWTTFWTPF